MTWYCHGACGVADFRRGLLVFPLVIMFATALQAADQLPSPIPLVKQCTLGAESVRFTSIRIVADPNELARAVAALRSGLADLRLPVADDGIPLRLVVGPVEFPPLTSDYRMEIERQGYRLRCGPREILIQAPTPQGVFYGIQTLLQLLDAGPLLRESDILDWPDLACRMVMIDSARQNENGDYYRRLIDFLARYKVNYLHWHLTDDEILSLYHEDYAALMHPHAWRVEEIRALVEFARQRYIEVMPEIESLGHARVFARLPDCREILHQTTFDKPSRTWAGTRMPGYTNVLCPASEKTYQYLDRMYARAAEAFPYRTLHVGCDEVEATQCARCEQAFPGVSYAEWMARHLLHCRGLVARHDRKMAMWGDMLLHHREVVEQLPRDSVVIYDWQYRREVARDSAAFFKEQGFEVIGCPALFCHPRMILPDDENFDNIAAFARVARELDLHGLDTTIWTPTRYMSDVLWPGIAFAAAQSWCGSNFDEDAFYAGLVRDFFGLSDGRAFARAWCDACRMRWHLDEFYAACWIDEQSLGDAVELLIQREAAVRGLRARLANAEKELDRLSDGVSRNHVAWAALQQSIVIRVYTMEHLLAVRDVRKDGAWNTQLVRDLDVGCAAALKWIEDNWDRNRFADDANKDGAYLPEQNLIRRFRQMHAFHQAILGGCLPQPTSDATTRETRQP